MAKTSLYKSSVA